MFLSRLVTEVKSLEYDFDDKVGRLHMGEFCCSDMSGTVELFERIDPDVLQIETFAAQEADAVYLKDPEEGWIARLPKE